MEGRGKGKNCFTVLEARGQKGRRVEFNILNLFEYIILQKCGMAFANPVVTKNSNKNMTFKFNL
jgi:hypothetical protein